VNFLDEFGLCKKESDKINLLKEASEIIDSVRIGFTIEEALKIPSIMKFSITIDLASVGGDMKKSTIEQGLTVNASIANITLIEVGGKKTVEQRGGQTLLDLANVDFEPTSKSFANNDITLTVPIPGARVDLNITQTADFIQKTITAIRK